MNFSKLLDMSPDPEQRGVRFELRSRQNMMASHLVPCSEERLQQVEQDRRHASDESSKELEERKQKLKLDLRRIQQEHDEQP